MPTFAERFEVYKNNVNTAMAADLADSLGVTVEAINRLGAGFHFGEQAWVFAERDAKGDVVGLSYRRLENGFKYMAKGSKRGLIYAYNQDYSSEEKRYDAGKFHWIRIADAGVECPVCGKPDWCMVSSDDPKDPSAVLCSRIKSGAAKELSDSGWLHILDPDRQRSASSNSVFGETQIPIIIVEGASDVLAGMSLGFTCIGRPSAKGGMGILKEMPLAGREVWIIGDNDAGAGREGVQKTYLNVKKMTETIQCIFPPEGIKDLRQWVQRGLTQEMLFEYAGNNGDTSIAIDPNVFPDDTAYIIADRFVKDYHTDESGIVTLRNFHGYWMQWNGHMYEPIDMSSLRGDIYRYLDGKHYVKVTAKGIDVVPYKPTRSKVADILDSMNRWCPVVKDPPVWLDDEEHTDPRDLILFKNGMLDVKEYLDGNIKLHNSDPRLFTRGVLPYDYDPNAWSTMFDDACNQWFNGDEERIRQLSQWYGYNMIADMSMEKLMLFLGPPRSGKGTCCEILQALIGRNQYCSTSFQALAGPHGLENISGKLAAIMGDAKTPRKSEADTALEIILRIVGGDYININPKHIREYDCYPTCRFTIAMNDLPRFSDHAQALVARSNILKFSNSYVGKEDFTLKARLKREAEQGKMINFALWGLKDLREQGKFFVPGTSEELIKELRHTVAPVLAFSEECCILDNSEYIATSQIFEAYENWCSIGNYKACNINTFGRRLKSCCPEIEDFRPKLDGRRQRTYKGITLQPWVYDEYIGRRK